MSLESSASTKNKRVFTFNFESDGQLLRLLQMHQRGLLTRGSTTKSWDLALSLFNEILNAGIVQPRTLKNRFRLLQNDLKARLLSEGPNMALNENEKLVKSMTDYIEGKQAQQAEKPSSKRQKTDQDSSFSQITLCSSTTTTDIDQNARGTYTPHKKEAGVHFSTELVPPNPNNASNGTFTHQIPSSRITHKVPSNVLSPVVASTALSHGIASSLFPVKKEPTPQPPILTPQRLQPPPTASLHLCWTSEVLDSRDSHPSRKPMHNVDLFTLLVVLQNEHTLHLNEAKRMVESYKQSINCALDNVFRTLDKAAEESAQRAYVLLGVAMEGTAILEEQTVALEALRARLLFSQPNAQGFSHGNYGG